MMENEKKFKLNLEDLKVQSFITNLDEDQVVGIYGGASVPAMRLGNKGPIVDVCRGGGSSYCTVGCSRGCPGVSDLGNCF